MNSKKFKIYQSNDLINYCSKIANLPHREIFNELAAFLKNFDSYGKFAIVYGLLYTGKSTILKQAVDLIDNKDSVAFIKFYKSSTDFMEIYNELNNLILNGKNIIFLDEITLLSEYKYLIDAIIEDGLHNQCKFVFSGTDSFVFWLSTRDELYDKYQFIYSTFISFNEWKNIFDTVKTKDHSFDDYIQKAGLFKDLDLDSYLIPNKMIGNIVDQYSYVAIARNIQNSIAKREYPGFYDTLYDLYGEDKLTLVIMNCVKKNFRKFIGKSLSLPYSYNDINILEKELSKYFNFNGEPLINLIDSKLCLFHNEIKHYITDEQANLVKDFLICLGMFKEIDKYSIVNNNIIINKEIILNQPCLRYGQILDLIDSIFEIIKLSENEMFEIKKYIYSRCVCSFFEEMVRLNAYFELSKQNLKVFKLSYEDVYKSGDFDFVIFDQKNKIIDLFEVKHGSKIKKSDAYKNFNNEIFISKIQDNFGEIKHKNIIFTGETYFDQENNINCINVNDFFTEIC